MTPAQIEEAKILAEYMGGVPTKSNGYRGTVMQFPVMTHYLYCHPFPDLKYHTSWDWLHDIWKKFKEEGSATTLPEKYYIFKRKAWVRMDNDTPAEAASELAKAITWLNSIKK